MDESAIGLIEDVIEINDKLLGIWGVWLTDDQDWLAALHETENPGEFTFTYRFRYYADEKAFGSKDKKSWDRYRFHATREEAVSGAREVARELAAAAGKNFDQVLVVNGNVKRFLNSFTRLNWVHAKQVG
jgi:hypothetical protein